MGLVGVNFGRHIVHELRRGAGAEFVELKGVCDLDRAKAEALAHEYGVPCYESLDAMLADPELEAIGLFTPPVNRHVLIDRVVTAGKHVMTTKPFDRDPEAAAAILAKAEKLGRVVHLNSPNPVPAPDIRQVLDWQREFDLGQPVLALWQTFANYRETPDGSWYDDPDKCPAAPVFRLGIYGINDLLQICGAPLDCSVQESRIHTGRPTADNAQLGIRFKNGCLGCIAASFCVDNGIPYRNIMIVHFERGTVTRNLPAVEAFGDRAVSTLTLQRTGGEAADPVFKTLTFARGAGSGTYQWENFRDAIRGKKLENAISPALIVDSIRVINAMYKPKNGD